MIKKMMNNENIIYIFFFINLILLNLNIIYIMKSNKIVLKMIYPKNVDIFFINFSLLSYKEMIKKFNEKKYNNSLILLNYTSLFSKNLITKNQKKTLILYFVDSYDLQINFVKNILQSKYRIKISPSNPDYLIYNVFKCQHLDKNYTNSIKIAIFTENQIPDFNIADYAISHAHINYLDRHFTYPKFFFSKLLLFNKYYKKARNKVLLEPIRKKFCAAVITNFWFTDNFRINFINELSKYKNVDMG